MHEVPASTTLVFGLLLLGLILCLSLEEKLHARKSVIAGAFALLCLFLGEVFGVLPTESVVQAGDLRITLPVYVPSIDWDVIAIILGSSLFVDITSKTGLFTYLAVRLTKASGGDPLRLLWAYGWMTVLFSAVLNNVTAMIIVGSLTAVSLERLGRREKLLGFLLIEGLLTNLGGLLTLISSVPNIIVGNAAGISFVRFFLIASPFVVVATTATLLLGSRLFGIHALRDPEARAEARAEVMSFDEHDGIESWFFFWFGAAMTLAFLGVMATTSVLPYLRELGMGYVAMTFAMVMLVRHKHEAHRFYEVLDWDLLGFFAGLFIVIGVMEHARVLETIGHGLARIIALGPTLGTGAVLLASAAFSSVTDNIPLSAMLAKILVSLGTEGTSPLWWSVVFGANLGGNLTPIGSASTLVAVTVIHRNAIPLSFGGFVRRALPFAALHLALAVAYVLIFL
jgi:Na+/H+ antiporter NhaD/arsenite permease-like protein